MADTFDRNDRADLVAAIVLVWAMLVAAWPPSASVLLSFERMLASLAGAASGSLARPIWAWPVEGLLIAGLGLGVMLWGRRQPAATTLALAGAVALALLGLTVLLQAAQIVSLHLGAPALTALAGAGLCVALSARREAAIARSSDVVMPGAAITSPLASDFGRTDGTDAIDARLAQARRALQQGDVAAAWKLLEGVRTTRQSFETLYEIATQFQRQGQAPQAIAALHRLRDRDPAYRDVVTRLQDLERASSTPGAGAAPARVATAAPLQARPSPAPAGAQHDSDKLVSGELVCLGRYEIVRELGRGAMGAVYLGRDPRINRVVAIKAIPLADEFEPDDLDDAKTRFFREAETAGRLNHPNIVTIYDVGEERDLAYIAMEFLEGSHLSGNVNPHTLLPMPVVADLVSRVADALGYAHRENVVHRDIKPANIMYDRNTDSLKITDFGIARLTDYSRTRTGIVLETPSFMSPEQLEGKQATGQSDLFSLGVSLYQLLTGQLPFRGSSMPKLMFAIANLAHAPVTSVRPELPADLDRIVDMALAKDPRKRYPTGAHMGQALRAFIARLGR
jgi:hypothetical protein